MSTPRFLADDVRTMKARAEARRDNGTGLAGLFLVPETCRLQDAAEDLILIWSLSTLEEWEGQIAYLPL